MNQGILKKIAVAGIAMLMLAALASGIGQAGSQIDTINPKPNTITDTIKPEPIKIKYATITYKPNYTGGPADVEDKPVMFSDYTIRTNPFTDSGYIFNGWNTKVDGTGTVYYAEQTVGAVNTTLYAQWKVTITYKSNYAGGQADVIDKPIKDSSYTIKNPFTRSGYTVNWLIIKPDWVDYPGFEVYEGQVIWPNGNYTLYAQWVEIPKDVDGRILPPTKTGDKTANWIEIARDGKYSLIVRAKTVAITYFSNSANGYMTSYVRGLCNAFFNSQSASSGVTLYSTLPANARLREYTVRNNAANKLGTSSTAASMNDGYSKPNGVLASSGNDVCFALSYTEAANFISRTRYIPGSGSSSGSYQPSPEIAIRNYSKLEWASPDSIKSIWLRSPCAKGNNNSVIYYGNTTLQQGMVCELGVGVGANVHPALWVDSAIFN